MPPPAVAIATCDFHPELDEDNGMLLEALHTHGIAATVLPWSTSHPWDVYDAVVVRETWDYSWRLDEFLAWTRAVGPRLLNPPAVIEWNADKRYLFELEEAGIPAIAGTLLERGGPPPEPPAGRFVVKPTVSGGSRDTALYDESGRDAAREHVARLHAAGRDVLLQPYYGRVDTEAETAVVFIGGELSHCMRKGPLLTVGQPPSDEPFRAEDMRPRAGEPDVLALARSAWDVATARFGPLLYGRVDILRSDAGEPAVLELELVEPSLFLDFAPGAADVLAAALARRVG